MPSALSILMANEVYKGTVHAPWQAENGVGGSTELMGPSFLQLSSHPRRLSTSHASWALLLLPAMGQMQGAIRAETHQLIPDFPLGNQGSLTSQRKLTVQVWELIVKCAGTHLSTTRAKTLGHDSGHRRPGNKPPASVLTSTCHF